MPPELSESSALDDGSLAARLPTGKQTVDVKPARRQHQAKK
jgi:hypothetical protein